MKHIKYLLTIIYIAAIPFFTVTPSALSENTKKKTVIEDKSGSIEIYSDSFKIDNKRHIVTFTGNVEAIRDDININCQKTELFYEDLGSDNDPEKDRFNILKIIATDNVIISRPDGGTAEAEKAIYYQDHEKVILTGNPAVVKQGTDFMEGAEITYFLKDETIEVEGSGDSRPTITLFPDKE